MGTDEPLLTDEDSQEEEITWPQTPSAIFILGKRQGTKKENKQLWGRVAMAAALWYSAPQPKPYIIFTASDIHGPKHIPDAQAVKQLLVEKFEIPLEFLILRHRVNCTLLEIRQARVLGRAYGLTQIFGLTHLYHAPRAQRYFDEVLSFADVIPVHPDILAEIEFPQEYSDLLPQLETTINESIPHKFDALREQIIEILLGLAHTIDRRGCFERWLAHVLRPTAYR
jgi:uncharacterized SAM-binding protein YcdF (DUF218 family)